MRYKCFSFKEITCSYLSIFVSYPIRVSFESCWECVQQFVCGYGRVCVTSFLPLSCSHTTIRLSIAQLQLLGDYEPSSSCLNSEADLAKGAIVTTEGERRAGAAASIILTCLYATESLAAAALLLSWN